MMNKGMKHKLGLPLAVLMVAATTTVPMYAIQPASAMKKVQGWVSQLDPRNAFQAAEKKAANFVKTHATQGVQTAIENKTANILLALFVAGIAYFGIPQLFAGKQSITDNKIGLSGLAGLLTLMVFGAPKIDLQGTAKAAGEVLTSLSEGSSMLLKKGQKLVTDGTSKAQEAVTTATAEAKKVMSTVEDGVKRAGDVAQNAQGMVDDMTKPQESMWNRLWKPRPAKVEETSTEDANSAPATKDAAVQ